MPTPVGEYTLTSLIMKFVGIFISLFSLGDEPRLNKPLPKEIENKPYNLLTSPLERSNLSVCHIKGKPYVILKTEKQMEMGFQYINSDEWEKAYPNHGMVFMLKNEKTLQLDKINEETNYVHMNNVEFPLHIQFVNLDGNIIQSIIKEPNNKNNLPNLSPIPDDAVFMIENKVQTNIENIKTLEMSRAKKEFVSFQEFKNTCLLTTK